MAPNPDNPQILKILILTFPAAKRVCVRPLPRWHAAAESGILCAIINGTERREGL